MKTKNLLFAGAIALSTVLSPAAALLSASPVSAAEVTIQSSGSGEVLENHTFKAVKIFSGDLSEDKTTLSNIQWADEAKGALILAKIKADKTYGFKFTDDATAADVAETLSSEPEATKEALGNAFAKAAYEILKDEAGTDLKPGANKIDDGYYLIIDTTENPKEGTAMNTALLQIVGSITIQPKTDAPTITKKVQENTKYNQDGGFGTGYNDTADYNLKTDIPFEFISKVPDLSRYDKYVYVIHDKMSTGLELVKDTTHPVTVTIGGKTLEENTDYTFVSDPEDDCTFEIRINDLVALAKNKGLTKDSEIKVTFTGKLNDQAVIGGEGNVNTVKLEYSNNPNDTGDGKTGTTPDDKVVVFTYEIDFTKVDSVDQTKKLDGAEFKIKNSDNKWAVVDDLSKKFIRWADSEDDGSILKSENNGAFRIVGLDDGTYTLKETKAPDGYNGTGREFTIILTADTSNKQDWDGTNPSALLTSVKVKLDSGSEVVGTPSNGSVAVNVPNTKGSTLPETGGMGTSMLYTVGAALVGGAAIFYVTNKRMKRED